jgi:hypothetical protein
MKFSDRAREVISAVAPVLGATLGGPLGGLAGNMLAQTLGVKPDDPKALENAILTQSPEVIGQIRLAEIELQKQAQANELDLERINAGDRASARARQIALGDSTPTIIAYVVIGATLFLEGYAFLHGLPSTVDKVIVGRILGTFDTATGMILTFFYGSSMGSKAKTDALTTIATQGK